LGTLNDGRWQILPLVTAGGVGVLNAPFQTFNLDPLMVLWVGVVG
jgi:hypothetical protein